MSKKEFSKMARRTKDEAEATRVALLDAAERVFYENGVSRSTLEQIATAAGVTRGAVYWHFRDKIALCTAMIDRVFLPYEDILQQLDHRHTKTPLTDLHKACQHALLLMANDKRRRKVFAILHQRCEYLEDMAAIIIRRNSCKDEMLQQFQRLFTRARMLGKLAPGWTPRLAAVSLQSMMSGLIYGSLEERKGYDVKRTGLACLRALFRAFRT